MDFQDLLFDLEVCTRSRAKSVLINLSTVAQRPPPGFPPGRNPTIGPGQGENIFSNGENYNHY